MAIDVSQYTAPIKTAAKARDVRDNIANGIDAIANEVNNYEADLSSDNDQFKEDIGTRQTNLENTFTQEIANQTIANPSNMETVAARTDNVNNKTYDTIGKRLDDHSSQLADMAKKFPKGNILTVSKNGGDFSTIVDAVTYANTNYPNQQITILIFPGIYNENVHVGGDKKISLVGINKKDCIIKLDTGLYSSQPLEIEGNAYVANLTFIHTHDASTDTIENLRGYAVHCDWPGAGTCEFFNCDCISYQNAATGCGLHQDQTLIFRNCNFSSYTPVGASMLTNGAFFCHSNTADSVTNQNLIMDNCYCYSINGYSMYINDANYTAGNGNGNSMSVLITNTRIMSKTLYIEDSLHVDTKPSGNNFSGAIVLTWDSLGNNCSKLNHNSSWWIPLTLLNGAQNFGGALQTAHYCKNTSGLVSVIGCIKNATTGTTIFQLPIGYRPIQQRMFPILTNSTTGQAICVLSLDANGNASILGTIGNDFTSIEFSFLADQ